MLYMYLAFYTVSYFNLRAFRQLQRLLTSPELKPDRMESISRYIKKREGVGEGGIRLVPEKHGGGKT